MAEGSCAWSADYLSYCRDISALGPFYLFYSERETDRNYLAIDGAYQYLAYTFVIHYFRDGCLFCHTQEELEGITQGPNEKNFTPSYFRFFLHRADSQLYLPKI